MEETAVVGGADGRDGRGGWWRGLKKVGEEDEVGEGRVIFFIWE